MTIHLVYNPPKKHECDLPEGVDAFAGEELRIDAIVACSECGRKWTFDRWERDRGVSEMHWQLLSEPPPAPPE